MACKDTAGGARRRCLEWEAQQRRECRNWRTEQTRRCDDWETTWEQRCTQSHTETERACDRWETERTQECSDWIVIFRWLCLAWTWVTTTVCRAWSWVSKTVCDVWTWVSTTVCRVWTLVSTLVCTLWVIVTTLVCRVWVFVLDTWCLFYCSLRRLFAPTEFSQLKSECIYGWTSAYRAEIDTENCRLNITLRIRLVADEGVSAADLTAGQAIWEPAIEAAWSGRFPLRMTDGSCTCEQYTVSVDVQFVNSNEHHTVTVHPGSGREDMTNWYVNTIGEAAAHEAGHMFGNVDEYADGNCPGRTVTSDGSIMENHITGAVLARHYASFANWLSNRTCCTYQAS